MYYRCIYQFIHSLLYLHLYFLFYLSIFYSYFTVCNLFFSYHIFSPLLTSLPSSPLSSLLSSLQSSPPHSSYSFSSLLSFPLLLPSSPPLPSSHSLSHTLTHSLLTVCTPGQLTPSPPSPPPPLIMGITVLNTSQSSTLKKTKFESNPLMSIPIKYILSLKEQSASHTQSSKGTSILHPIFNVL